MFTARGTPWPAARSRGHDEGLLATVKEHCQTRSAWRNLSFAAVFVDFLSTGPSCYDTLVLLRGHSVDNAETISSYDSSLYVESQASVARELCAKRCSRYGGSTPVFCVSGLDGAGEEPEAMCQHSFFTTV